MNRDDVIRMAREAGILETMGYGNPNMKAWQEDVVRELSHFAALVAAAERNRAWTQDHWTEYERSIAAAEREACIDIVAMHGGSVEIEAAIRARGQA